MTDITTILVHVDLHDVPAARVKFASDLARRFGAKLVGISAAQMPSVTPSIGRDRFARYETAEIEGELEKVHATFNDLVASPGLAEWRGVIGSPTRAIADHSLDADLIVVSAHGSDLAESDVGDLAMASGRPVLVPAPDVESLSAKCVLVAWKNTREARRAVRDSLPFLAMAENVRIASFVKDDHSSEDLDRLVVYLSRHGVSAEPLVVKRDQRRFGTILIEQATSIGADLIVAGAYGHSRFRQLAFGGATHDLLHQAQISVLLSN